MNKNIVYNKDFIIDNIKEVVEQATSSHFTEAKQWYPKAHEEAQRMSEEHDLDLIITSSIISILSPMKSWWENLKISKQFLEGKRSGHFTKQIQKGVKILNFNNIKSFETQKQSLEFIIGGKKTINFMNNIFNSLDNNYLTIDVHMLSICYGGLIKSVTDKQYEFLKNIFQIVS